MRKDIIFTSELLIDSNNEQIENYLFEKRKEEERYINKIYNIFNKNSLLSKFVNEYGKDEVLYYILHEFDQDISRKEDIFRILFEYNVLHNHNYKWDLTCFLKGLFLYRLIKNLDFSDKKLDFIISFGQDICGFNRKNIKLKVENSNKTFRTPRGMWGCFTSGNYGARGEHIISNKIIINKSATIFGKCEPKDLPFMDAYATYYYAENGNTFLMHTDYKCYLEEK